MFVGLSSLTCTQRTEHTLERSVDTYLHKKCSRPCTVVHCGHGAARNQRRAGNTRYQQREEVRYTTWANLPHYVKKYIPRTSYRYHTNVYGLPRHVLVSSASPDPLHSLRVVYTPKCAASRGCSRPWGVRKVNNRLLQGSNPRPQARACWWLEGNAGEERGGVVRGFGVVKPLEHDGHGVAKVAMCWREGSPVVDTVAATSNAAAKH